MAQSDARFGYRAKLSRDDHDLSQVLNFTTPPGLLCPVWFDFATPGDSYYMQHDMPLLRSIQLLAPMMTDVKVHFETFFVPMQMLYQPIENTLFSLTQIQSSNFDINQLLNNNLPLFNFSNWLNGVKDSPTSKFDAFRLADFFGLSPLAVSQVGAEPSLHIQTYTPSFFPWQILTYKAIFHNYYRLDDKTNFKHDFNWDEYYADSTAITPPVDFMRMYDRPWDFDYFTSMYRSPIVSNANLQTVLPNMAYSPLTRAEVRPVNYNTAIASNNNEVTSFANPVTTNEYLNSATIRQLFANEKLAMITGRTRKNYDSQVLAHYGVNVPHDVKHDLTMIHHDVYDLNVLEVTSLASTEDAPLGELAGKSISRGNGEKFKFTAPCHGVMMTIFSVEPKRVYTTGFDRINAVTNAFDLPVPEFDRLGNVPMYRYEGLPRTTSGILPTDIVGWKERYYQFKRKMPKATLAFFSSNGVNNYASYVINSAPHGIPNGYVSEFGPALSRPDLPERFYIARDSLNAQCILNYVPDWQSNDEGENWNTTPWLAYSRDPFIVDSHIKCMKISWMSKDGEPVYD